MAKRRKRKAFAHMMNIVMCENICNYSVEILEECIGEIDESSELMREIEKAVQIQIGIIG